MKGNLLALLAILAAIVSAAVAWQQSQRAAKLEADVAAVNAELRELRTSSGQQNDLVRQLRSENEAYTGEASALREKLAARSSAIPPPTAAEAVVSASAAPKKGDMREMISDMMKDPKMKEMMHQQQSLSLKQLYGDFVASHRFSPQQADQFFDLLMQKHMDDAEVASEFFDGKKEDPDAAALRSTADREAETDRRLQMLLGDAAYSSYKDYQNTVGERMALTQIRQQLAVSSSPLGNDQANTLLQVMVEERAQTASSPFDAGAPGNAREKFRTLSDESAADRHYQEQADLNQRVLNRAGSILKPDQLSALAAFQKQQLEMQKLGMEMARKIMGEDPDATHTYSIMPATGR